jgi:hypothetical protein
MAKLFSVVRINRFALLLIIFLSNKGFTQKADTDVQKILLKKDSLFWEGYNTCNLPLLARFLSDDIKFYHDKGGMTSGLENFKKRLQQNICSDSNYNVRRALVPGTVKLFFLKKDNENYGAITSYEQRFYHFENGRKLSEDDDVAKCICLWLYQNGEWKMHEIFSFAHEPMSN